MTDEVRSSLRDIKEIQLNRVQKDKEKDESIADLERTVEFTEDRLNSVVAALHSCQANNVYLREENKMLIDKLHDKEKPQPPPIRRIKEGQIPGKKPTWPGWWFIALFTILLLVITIVIMKAMIHDSRESEHILELTLTNKDKIIAGQSKLIKKGEERFAELSRELDTLNTIHTQQENKLVRELSELEIKYADCIAKMEKYFERMKAKPRKKEKTDIIMCDHTDPLSCIIEQHKPLEKEETDGASVSSNNSSKTSRHRILPLFRDVGGTARNQPY